MNLIPLIGLSLKDPQIIELLERHEADVVYDFDRLFENQPDTYWAHLYSQGLLLKFNARQFLTTIFVYIRPTDEYAAHRSKKLEFEVFPSLERACAFAESRSLEFISSAGKEGIPEWVRIAHPTCYVHYQFSAEGLSLVTIMSLESAPGAA